MVLAFAPFEQSALMLLAPLGAAWVCRAPARRPWLVALCAAIGILPAWLYIQQWVIPCLPPDSCRCACTWRRSRGW